MKHRQILIRVFLVILCLPLSACLFKVSGTSGVKYPIGGEGIVDLTKVPLMELESLKLRAFNLFPSENLNVSLECKSDGSFTQVYDPYLTKTLFNLTTPPDFWGLVTANCDQQADGDNYVIELALKLGDKYAPILTQANLECVVSAIVFERKKGLPALAGCVASDPRLPGPSTDPYGFNTNVEGINVLKLLVPQEVL
jgi:hypothetical protein